MKRKTAGPGGADGDGGQFKDRDDRSGSLKIRQPIALAPLTESEIAARSPSWDRGPLADFWHLAGLAARSRTHPVGVFYAPKGQPFVIDTNFPSAVLIVPDRGRKTTGPGAFERESLATVIGGAERVDLVTAPVGLPYDDQMRWAAVVSFRGVVIETPPARLAGWTAFIREIAPAVPLKSWNLVVTSHAARRGVA